MAWLAATGATMPGAGEPDSLAHDAAGRAAVTIGAALLLYMLVLARLLRDAQDSGGARLRALLWTSAAFGVAAQIAGAVAAADPYRLPYGQAISGKAAALGDVAQARLRSGDSGLDPSAPAWQGIRALLASTPEIASVVVRDARGDALRIDGAQVQRSIGPRAPDVVDRIRVWSLVPLETTVSRDAGAGGSVTVRIAASAVRGKLLDLAADTLAAVMVSVLVFLELLLLMHASMRRTARAGQPPRNDDACAVMRPAVFLFLFGVDLSMSFVPLHMERLYEPLLGLSREVVLGLPISVEFLFVGLAILGAGAWVDRSGWRPPFLAGTAIAAAGAIGSWLASDAASFIASRAVLGIGYGLTLMASQGFVIRACDARHAARGLAWLFAGIYGGSICGGVAGALLAEQLGFGPVFAASGLIVLGVLAYAPALLPGTPHAAEARVGDSPPDRATPPQTPCVSFGVRFLRFLGNRTMLALILCSSLPASIAAVGFLNYFSPIYLDRIGASQSTIGQVLMLYGVCLVFFGPWVSRSIDRASRKRVAVIAGCLLGSAALLGFRFLEGLGAAVFVVIGLGLAHSLVLSSQTAYALALRVSRELGEGKAVSVFRSSSRLGQMLGPVAFAAVAVAGDVSEGITVLGYAYLAAAVLFWLLTRRDQHLLAEEPTR